MSRGSEFLEFPRMPRTVHVTETELTVFPQYLWKICFPISQDTIPYKIAYHLHVNHDHLFTHFLSCVNLWMQCESRMKVVILFCLRNDAKDKLYLVSTDAVIACINV